MSCPHVAPARVQWLASMLLCWCITALFAAGNQSIVKSIDEDSSLTIRLGAEDDDGHSIKWSVGTPPANGSAEIDGRGKRRRISYVPNADWNGTDSFVVSIQDDAGGESLLTVQVNVQPQNDAPLNTMPPRLAGSAQPGQTLTVDKGTWDDSRDGPGALTYTYRWQAAERNSLSQFLDIPEATNASYKVNAEDQGLYLRVLVTASDQGMPSQSATEPSNTFMVGNIAPRFILESEAPTAPIEGVPAPSVVPTPVANQAPVGTSAPVVAQPEPAPEPELSVHVKSIRFTGNNTVESDILQTTVEEYVDRECTLSELRTAADAVTILYRTLGMVLAKAYIPQQDVSSGTIEIRIVEGEPGYVEVEGNERHTDEFVRHHIQEALGQGAYNNKALERALLILNEDIPNLNVSTVLQRGQKPGTVDILAKVEEDKAWDASIAYNNFGSDFVSQNRYTLSLGHSSLFRLGDQTTLSGVFGDDPSDLAYGTLQYRTPINYHGTQVGASVSHGSYEVSQEFADLGLEGDSSSARLYVSHPFIKQRKLTLEGEFGFESKDSTYSTLGSKSRADRLRFLYATLQASGNYSGGYSEAILNLSQGLGDFLGGMDEGEVSASRPGADNSFTRMSLSLARLQKLTDHVGLFVRAGGQVASDSLASSEEFQAGGINSVRGYSPGEATGDNGYQASVELQLAPWESKPYTFIAFLDHAYVYQLDSLVAQDSDLELTGAGLGLRMQHHHEKADGALRLDLGWPVGPGDNSLGDDPVFYISTEVRF